MHLIRNAIDHGIEPPDGARARGQAADGRGRGSPREQKGNHVVDRGRGRRRAASTRTRVREVAVARGLVTAEAVARAAPARAAEPHLPARLLDRARRSPSSPAAASGMDVVKNNIANLSGHHRRCRPSAGGARASTITLPITLAIIRALVVAVGGPHLRGAAQQRARDPRRRAREVRTVERREVI